MQKEKIALEVYPVSNESPYFDVNEDKRKAYKEGIIKGEELMLERVCEWMKKNLTFIHPRKGTEECFINFGKFKDDMMDCNNE